MFWKRKEIYSIPRFDHGFSVVVLPCQVLPEGKQISVQIQQQRMSFSTGNVLNSPGSLCLFVLTLSKKKWEDIVGEGDLKRNWKPRFYFASIHDTCSIIVNHFDILMRLYITCFSFCNALTSPPVCDEEASLCPGLARCQCNFKHKGERSHCQHPNSTEHLKIYI